jgi:hypothetical protein
LSGGGILGIATVSIVNGTGTITNQTYTKAENIKLQVTDTNNITGKSNTITVIGTVDSTSKIGVTANPGSIITGQSSEVTVALTDTYSNPLGNIYVTFNVIKGSGTISEYSVLTSNQGVAKVTFTRTEITKPEVNTIRATAGSLTADVNINVGVLITSSGGTIVASEDPNTTAVIPQGALSSDISICIKLPSDLTATETSEVTAANNKAASETISGTVRSFMAFNNDGSNYSSNFARLVTIKMPYTDNNNDDIVDGTTINVADLKIMRLNESKEEWSVVTDGGINRVDKANKVVEAEVKHFSIYTLGKVITANLDNIVVYPNPVNFSKAVRNTVKFGNLSKNPEIKIFTINGRLVKTLRPGTIENDGATGKAEWNGKNEDGSEVEMGLYVYMIKDDSGHTKTGRLGVVK